MQQCIKILLIFFDTEWKDEFEEFIPLNCINMREVDTTKSLHLLLFFKLLVIFEILGALFVFFWIILLPQFSFMKSSTSFIFSFGLKKNFFFNFFFYQKTLAEKRPFSTFFQLVIRLLPDSQLADVKNNYFPDEVGGERIITFHNDIVIYCIWSFR